MKLTLTPLGGAAEIGANAYLLETPCGNVLLDCGLRVSGEQHERLPLLTRINVLLHAVIVTHAHTDHIGALPVVAAEFPGVPVYMTAPTKFLGDIMLADSGNVMRKTADPDNPPWYLHLYDVRRNLPKVLDRITIVDAVHRPHQLAGTRLSLQFFNAGHILGSAMVKLTFDGCTVVYTGDLNLRDTLSERAADLAGVGEDVDVLITESTYGKSLSNGISRDQVLRSFGRHVTTTTQRGGCVLIPAFAVGRTQEVLLAIARLKRENKIDPALPVYVAGLGNKVCKVYQEYSDIIAQDAARKNMFGEYTQLYRVEDRADDIIARPGIIVATNGMLASFTPSALFAQKMLPDPRHTILFPGYVGEEADGYSLLSGRSEVKLNNCIVQRSCTVDRVDFSAHASGAELLDMLQRLRPRCTVLVHGDGESIECVRNEAQRHRLRTVFPKLNGERLRFDVPPRADGRAAVSVACSSERELLVITVGTSILSHYAQYADTRSDNARANRGTNKLPDENSLLRFVESDPQRRSAELNTILSTPWVKRKLPSYKVVLICSGDGDGRGARCGDVLRRYLSETCRVADAECVVIDDLCDDVRRFRENGLRRFVLTLVDLVQAYRDTVIVATGGYKATTAYATLIGILRQKTVLYVHEDFKSDDPVIQMPRIPLSFDFTGYAKHADTLNMISALPDTQRAAAIREKLPPQLAELFTRDAATGRMRRNILGDILVRLYGEWEQAYLRKKRHNCRLKVHIPGLLPEPAHNAAPQYQLDDIQDKRVRSWLNLLLKLSCVRSIAVTRYQGPALRLPPPVSQESGCPVPVALQFMRMRTGMVECRLIWNGRLATVRIDVVPKYEKDCVSVITEFFPQQC